MPFKSDKQRRFLWSQKPEVAKQIAYRQEGGPMMDSRKPKKITQKDRYGNQVSVEYNDEQKPFDINAVLEKLLDRDVPEMLTIPESSPIGGGVSIGFADAHPGEPRGSDTVPAWLTPGEFVVNKEAMDDPQNAQAVMAINEQGRQVQQMKHGGPLQMHRMPGGVAMGGAAHLQQGGDTRNFFDRLKLLAGFEDTPAVPDRPTPVTVAPQEPVPTSRPISPEQVLIQAREGYREDVYEDTRGYNTVGFGHRTDEPLGSVPYTRAQNESNLDDDIEIAKANAESYAGDKWKDLNKQQKAALTSMALQLGGAGQREFELMQEALRAGDWAGVRREARDSDWAGQTPARVEDIEAAFRYGGGPIYAQTGLPVGAQGSGRTLMYNPETGQYEYADEQMLPDILAGQEEGAAAAAAQSQSLTDQFAAEDEQANMDYEGVTDFSSGPMTVPETETPPPVPNKATENMGLLGQAIDYFGGPSDAANIGAEEREAQQNRGRTADKEAALDQAETELSTLEESAAAAIEAGDYQAYGKLRADAARKQTEIDHRKDEVLSAQAEQANDITDHKARRVARQNEIVTERLTMLAEAHTAAIDAGDSEAVAAIEEEIDEVAASKDTDPHGEEAAAKELKNNEPGPEDDKATLEDLAESEEFENEDAPDKDSDKGTQSTPEVVAEGEAAAKADPSKLDKAKGFFKDAFSDLFDGKELARMALMYVGSRALGYSHGGSLNWAAKQYATRLDAKASTLAANAKEFAKTGKYTPASVAAYQKSGDLSALEPVGVTDQVTGNTNARTIGGQKVAFQEIKRGDNTLYKAPDGTVYTAAQLENATQPFEASFQKGTPEYRTRRSRATNDAAGRFEEVWKAEDTIPGGRDKPATHFTNIRPKQASDEFWSWSEGMGLDPESDEALQIMTQAYRQAIQDGKSGDVKPTSLKPYLEQQYIREKSGAPELFITNADDLKPGQAPKYVRGDKMASLDRNLEAVASQLPALQGLSPKDAKDRMYGLAIEEWNALDEDAKKQYNRSATDDESGFYVFLNKRAAQLLTKSGG